MISMIDFDTILDHSKGQTKQLLVLVKHFFHRLFQNDVVDFEDQMKERIVGILAIIFVFCGLLSYALVSKYGYLPDTGTSWIEKCVLIIFCMLIMGFVAVFEWDIMFPDARDYVNLNPLPIKAGTIFFAKFASLCLLVGLFALGMTGLSTVVFWVYLPQWQSPNILYSLYFALVHFMSVSLACFFAFFINVFLICILMTLLGYKLFNRISTYIKSFLLVVHIFLSLIYLRIVIYGFENLVPLERLKASDSYLRYFYDYFPPLWFTDFYETLVGNTNLPFHGTLSYALIGLLIMMGTFFITTGLSYRRYLKKMGSVQRKKIHLRKLRMFFTALLNFIFLRNRIQRAVFHFYGKTLKASMFHKMRLASFVAIGVGLVPFQIALKNVTPTSLFGINRAVLSIPLILSFFLLLGLRGVVNMPISIESNWIFQITEDKNIRHYLTGFRKAVVFLNLLPLCVFLFICHIFLWDVITAFYHCLYGLVVSVLVMEVLFLKYCKIPFACTYLPGKEKLQLFWFPYLILFLVYINLMSWIELELLRFPSSFFIFYGIVFFVYLAIRIYQLVFFNRSTGIQYEERPEPVMVGLDYEAPKHKRQFT